VHGSLSMLRQAARHHAHWHGAGAWPLLFAIVAMTRLGAVSALRLAQRNGLQGSGANLLHRVHLLGAMGLAWQPSAAQLAVEFGCM